MKWETYTSAPPRRVILVYPTTLQNRGKASDARFLGNRFCIAGSAAADSES